MSQFASDNDDHPCERSVSHDEGAGADETESAAWRRVFAQSEAGLRSFLRARLPQMADVDDCLQSVFIAMIHNTTDVPAAARRAWLFTVAAREAAKFWRQRATTDRVMEKHASAYVTQSNSPTEIEKQEVAHQIRQAIEKLPESSRRIVQLRIHHDLTFAAIADQLQLPLGTVLTRMRRAMQQLRDDLGDLHPNNFDIPEE